MLLAGALTLIVPVVGWQSVKQLYSALQQTRIDDQTLMVANMRLALAESPELPQVLDEVTRDSQPLDLYAELSPYPLFLDGYADDWKTLQGEVKVYASDASSSQPPVKVRVARRDKELFLHISVTDEQVVYHEIPVFRSDAGEGEQPDRWTQLVNGDSVELLIQEHSRRREGVEIQHGLFRAIAPGPLTALQASDKNGSAVSTRNRAGTPIQSWQAYWEKSVGGYQLEVQLPLPASGSAIAITVVDIDQRGEQRERWSGAISPNSMAKWHAEGLHSPAPGRIYYHSEHLARRLETWVSPGVRARLFDNHGRLAADANKLYAQADVDEENAEAEAFSSRGVLNALLFRLFSFFVAGDLPLLPETRTDPISLSLSAERRAKITDDASYTSRYVTEENDRVLGTLAPVGSNPRFAYLLLEANEEHQSAYAGSHLARLFSLLLLVSLLAGSGLLIFALVLSSRIRKLSRLAQRAVSVDGRVQGLPGSEARDEIGDLSRNLSSLLSRSAAYTTYLEALSSRLSHELRTPLSVVRTSIENLDLEKLDDESRLLIERASAGTDHLGVIIKALVDSTRIEQIVLDADRQTVDLSIWLKNCADIYSQVYSDVSITTSPKVLPSVVVYASSELLKQAFDKLVENAIDFNDGTGIVLQMTLSDDKADARVHLGVANKGPAIDVDSADELFSPLVSKRERKTSAHNLGLGLYVVRLVAESSGGEVFAHNRAGWVVVGMSLPIVKS